MSSRLLSLFAAAQLAQGPLRTFLEEVAGAVGVSINLSNAAPQNVGVTSPGVGLEASRGDHAHAHGDQAGGTLHALASPDPGGLAGFLSAADKLKLDRLPATFVESFNLRTGIVAPQAGDYTAADVGADPVGAAAAVGAAIVGTIGQPGGIAGLNGASEISDTTHGARAGGTLHADATTSVAGFLSAADKTKLDRQSAIQGSFFVKSVGAGQAQTTRSPGAVFEGCIIPVPFPTTVSTLYGRLTSLTTLGAGLRVGLYQVPGGQLNGNAALLGSANVTPLATGAQDLALPLGGAVSLEPGFAFLLYGRNSVTTGLTLRVWSVGSIDGLTTLVPAGQVPACFLTALSSLLAPPASILTSSLTPLTTSPAWLGRLS